MSQVKGLYISVDKTGKIKRSLTTQSGETKLKITTIEDELILFSELNFKPYAEAIELLSSLSEQIEINGEENFGEVDMNIYHSFLQTTDMLISLLKEENSIWGLLTETLLDDCTTPDDGTAMYIYKTKDIIIDCLSQAMELHFYINMLFNDLRMGIPLDIQNKYSFLSESEYIQIFTYTNKFTMKYRFRSIAGYYTFLLIRFISSKPNVAWCECCGRYFIPKTKKKTLYCDRIINDTLNFKAWIIGIARNKCNDYYRKRAKVMEIPLEEITETKLSYSRFGITETNVVRETISSLADNDKQILYLFFFRDLSQSEIAANLNIPIGTVKSRLHTAKQNFKEKYPYPPKPKGDFIMKKLPEFMPEYKIEKSEKEPFPVVWEELWGLFIVPKEGEKLTWGIYETDNHKCTEWGEMSVTGKARVHSIDGVEIKEYRHNHFGVGKDDPEHYYIAQLTDTHCRILAENYIKDGIRKYLTFLDGDDFITEWGYGENNCGKETNIKASSNIAEKGGEIIAQNTDQLCDIVGRYTITISGKSYDTVRIISLDSYCGEYVASEQYLDQNGRTILWRRFNRDDWAFDRYQQKWSEKLPNNEQLNINGETYVHWYDCITDYIL